MQKKWKKEIMRFLVCILAFGTVFMSSSVFAQAKGKGKASVSGKAKKAILAYQNFLGQGKIKWSDKSYDSGDFKFMLEDVNSDKAPELFLKCVGNASHYEGYEAVYYFHKNKVKLLAKNDAITAFYPKKGVVEMQYYGMGGSVSYHRIPKNGKGKCFSSISGEDDPGQETYYEWNGKKVTKSKCRRLLKKALGKKKVKVKESGWIDNTAANRASMSMKMCICR